VEAAAALSATERGADAVREALPMLREAVAQDGSSLEPMDAETSAQVAELLTCIERDLGGAA